jgi:hypothetical protein
MFLTVLWIRIHIILITWNRIKENSGSGSNKNLNSDPHQSHKLDPEPDPHRFADKAKCMEYESFRPLYLEARIWIRNLRKVTKMDRKTITVLFDHKRPSILNKPRGRKNN